MSENSTVSKTDFQTAEEALEIFNGFLEKLNLKQRWDDLQEIKVAKQTNWRKILTSEEFLKIIQWILIVNMRMQFIDFLNTIQVFFFILAYYLVITAYFFYKKQQEKKSEFPQLMTSLLKEFALFLVIFLAFEERFLNLPLPSQIKSISFFFFPVIVFSQYSIITDLNLTYKLNNRIIIQGQNWKISRLAMVFQKAVDLHQFYLDNYEKSLKLKKQK